MHKMKKPQSRKSRRKRKKIKVISSQEENSIENFYKDFIPLGKHGALWLFISTFMVFFISYQLYKAATTLTILKLRLASSLAYSDFPLWFIFIALFNIALWLLSVGYIWYYFKQRIVQKNA